MKTIALETVTHSPLAALSTLTRVLAYLRFCMAEGEGNPRDLRDAIRLVHRALAETYKWTIWIPCRPQETSIAIVKGAL
jgi:hypothetical protein